jgi:hypothetical protein
VINPLNPVRIVVHAIAAVRDSQRLRSQICLLQIEEFSLIGSLSPHIQWTTFRDSFGRDSTVLTSVQSKFGAILGFSCSSKATVLSPDEIMIRQVFLEFAVVKVDCQRDCCSRLAVLIKYLRKNTDE